MLQHLRVLMLDRAVVVLSDVLTKARLAGGVVIQLELVRSKGQPLAVVAVQCLSVRLL